MRLAPERYWLLTPHAYAALMAVHMRAKQGQLNLWAIERSDFRNAHRLSEQEGVFVPWTVKDILQPTAESRLQDMLAKRRADQRLVAANAQLGKMKPGEDHPLARKWKDEDLKKIDWAALSRRTS